MKTQYQHQLSRVNRGECRCDCGNLATRIKQGEFVCARCDAIEKDLDRFHVMRPGSDCSKLGWVMAGRDGEILC
jgi:hypothetical protein